MATKRDAIKALQKHTPGAVLDDETVDSNYCVQIQAPCLCIWEDGYHCKVINKEDEKNKSEFWDSVIFEIENFLPDSVLCSEDTCSSVRTYSECEYWHDEG